jgi:hypothetical protein
MSSAHKNLSVYNTKTFLMSQKNASHCSRGGWNERSDEALAQGLRYINKAWVKGEYPQNVRSGSYELSYGSGFRPTG